MEDIKLIRIDKGVKVREEQYFTLTEAREIIKREKIEEIKEALLAGLMGLGFSACIFLYIFLY